MRSMIKKSILFYELNSCGARIDCRESKVIDLLEKSKLKDTLIDPKTGR